MHRHILLWLQTLGPIANLLQILAFSATARCRSTVVLQKDYHLYSH